MCTQAMCIFKGITISFVQHSIYVGLKTYLKRQTTDYVTKPVKKTPRIL